VNFTRQGFGGMPLFFFIWFAAVAIVHILFAVGVYQHAAVGAIRGRRTELVSPMVWAFATLVGGVLVASAYWLIHASALNPSNDPATAEGPPDA
jgi:hypothetical protein